jgi:uncharacterized membrane protein
MSSPSFTDEVSLANRLVATVYSPVMVLEELRRMLTWSERHRRLFSRIMIAFCLSALVDLVGGLLTWLFERGAQGTQIHGYGDALFFSTVQILTISSSLKNPLTTGGRIVDVALEFWAIFVVTALAGSFASFFRTGDLT